MSFSNASANSWRSCSFDMASSSACVHAVPLCEKAKILSPGILPSSVSWNKPFCKGYYQYMSSILTTVYNCAQIKLTTPRYGGSLWEMLLSIPTGDGHDQEQDS